MGMPDQKQLEDVNDIYARIFGEDPLLLKSDSQEEFGQQILKNLLIERALKSKPPSAIQLYDGDERREFKSPSQAKPRRPNAALRKVYPRSVSKRSDEAKSHIDQLESLTMFSKGWLTMDRTNRTYFSCSDARDDLEFTGSPFDKRIRIAAVGYRVAISSLQEQGFFDEDLSPRIPKADKISLTKLPEVKSFQKLRRTKLLPKARYQRWVTTILRHVDAALQQGSQFVVFPEFALPPKRDKGARPIEKQITKIASRYEHSYFLFSGSRHEGLYNRGFILTRDENERRPAERWWHYKVASARSLGENVMGPQNPVTPSYRFTVPAFEPGEEELELEVVVAICVDVFDTSTFINYVINAALAASNYYRTIILVPSFNPSREFLHALRDLSFLAACPVIYVNGLHGDAKLFLYGIAVSDLDEIEKIKPDVPAAEADSNTSKVMATLTDVKRAIEQSKQRDTAELHVLERAALRKERDTKLDRLMTKRRVKLEKRLEAVTDQLTSIELLEKDLHELHSRGAFKHMITVEYCDSCAHGDHGSEEYCPSDILYYNLDPLLLQKLQRFRRDYFKRDKFLPTPFQTEELRKARARYLRSEVSG
jgi:hypothetical protein